MVKNLTRRAFLGLGGMALIAAFAGCKASSTLPITDTALEKPSQETQQMPTPSAGTLNRPQNMSIDGWNQERHKAFLEAFLAAAEDTEYIKWLKTGKAYQIIPPGKERLSTTCGEIPKVPAASLYSVDSYTAIFHNAVLTPCLETTKLILGYKCTIVPAAIEAHEVIHYIQSINSWIYTIGESLTKSYPGCNPTITLSALPPDLKEKTDELGKSMNEVVVIYYAPGEINAECKTFVREGKGGVICVDDRYLQKKEATPTKTTSQVSQDSDTMNVLSIIGKAAGMPPEEASQISALYNKLYPIAFSLKTGIRQLLPEFFAIPFDFVSKNSGIGELLEKAQMHYVNDGFKALAPGEKISPLQKTYFPDVVKACYLLAESITRHLMLKEATASDIITTLGKVSNEGFFVTTSPQDAYSNALGEARSKLPGLMLLNEGNLEDRTTLGGLMQAMQNDITSRLVKEFPEIAPHI